MKKFVLGASFLSLVFPIFAMAQLNNVIGLIDSFGEIIDMLIPIAFALALLYFFYGVAKYILAAGDAKAASDGKSIMIYGVIALFVMASIWGIVEFIRNAFGVDNDTTITVPGVR